VDKNVTSGDFLVTYYYILNQSQVSLDKY